ncbi:MAG: LysR family transcriptional regulator [Gammaproteobacteria bacterium]|nr:LysR family transcriptional regulator [Gammaproteobacteria bacterium]
MDIKLLEDFVCLAALESFTAASRERHITQSALSRRIKALEEWLGTDLVDRGSKNFSLTAQGRIFVPEAEVTLRRLYNARDAVRVLGDSEEFEITVAAQNSIAQTLFLDWVKRIEARFDRVFVRLLSEKLSECINLLDRGHVNYLFCYANESLTLPIDENKFAYTTIGKESLVPVTIPDQNKAPLFRLPGSREDPLPFIAYAHDSIFGRAVDQLTQDKNHTCFLSRRYENPYSHTLKSLVQEKLGFAWLPMTSIVSDLEQGRLCRSGDEHWDIEFDIRLYYHHAASSSQELAVLESSLEMAAELIT